MSQTPLVLPAQFDYARLACYDELTKRHLGHWPRMILRPVLEGTLARGQTWMYVQNLPALAEAAGLRHTRDASVGLKTLVGYHILDVQPWPLIERKAASIVVAINVLFSQWTAPISNTYTQLEQWLDGLEQPEPSVREAWLRCFIEQQEAKLLQISPMPRTAVRPEGSAHSGYIGPGRDAGRDAEGGQSARPENVGSLPTKPGGVSASRLPPSRDESGPVAKSVTDGPDVRPASAAAVTFSARVTEAEQGSATETAQNATDSARENAAEPAVAKNATDPCVTDAQTASVTVPMARSAVSPRTPLAIAVQQEQVQPGLNELPGDKSPSEQLQLPPRPRARSRSVAKSATAPKVTWQQVRDLERDLVAVIGMADFHSRRVLWLQKMIYRFPDELNYCLERHAQLEPTGYFKPNRALDAGRPPGTDHRIKWLIVAVARAAGIVRWRDVAPGCAPIE